MGRGAFYYVTMTAVLMVLALSANTSFADFPRVCRVLAADHYLPPEFARRLLSSDGKQDGLYWPAAEGVKPSPLGPLVAEAFEEGYRGGTARPTPYHGYLYRLLTAQGPSAPGGARNYLDDKGRLTRGFAVVAWPATYDNSGVMTFVVNQQGIVFQKDLGPDGGSVRAYDPDPSWTPTAD